MKNVTFKGEIFVRNVKEAKTFWDRLSGYMFRKSPHVEAILFSPAAAIHTFFMHFSLDIIFMDKNYKILKIYHQMKPWRHTGFHFRSRYTLEIPTGRLPKDLQEGDILEVYDV